MLHKIVKKLQQPSLQVKVAITWLYYHNYVHKLFQTLAGCWFLFDSLWVPL